MSHYLLLLAQLLTLVVNVEGRVQDQDGNPIAGARVVISSAAPKPGGPRKCPRCFDECGSSSLTDKAGKFSIPDLNDQLSYRIAVAKHGYEGRLLDYPKDGAESDDGQFVAQLQASPENLVQKVQGLLLGIDGKPLANAVVSPRGISYGRITTGRNDKLVTSLALTDEAGQFWLKADEKVSRFTIRITAPRSTIVEQEVSTRQEEPVTFSLTKGASLRGRLVHEGRPLAGVKVGLVQTDRTVPNLVTPMEFETGDDGVFQFDHIDPLREYAVYTLIQQNAQRVLPVSLVMAPGNGKRAELGDVSTETPSVLRIKLQTSDEAPLPEKSVIFVSRDKAWQAARYYPEGKVEPVIEVLDAPREAFQITVRVPGYRVLRTVPTRAADINGRYRINVKGNTSLAIFLAREKDD